MTIEEIYKSIDTVVLRFRKHRKEDDYLSLATDGITLLEFMPSLIDYSVLQEANYRKFEAGLIDELDGEKKRTSSYCETKAKATSFYQEWQKAKLMCELVYEMVNMSKVLARSVDKSLIAS